MDEFSSNMVWLMTQKTEIFENFLDEFSRIRQIGWAFQDSPYYKTVI